MDNERSLQAVERLEELYEVLCQYGVEKYVSFDLGLLSKYNYYTGIVFKAYTYGVGDAVAKGGRYDSLLDYFGKEAAAVGFVLWWMICWRPSPDQKRSLRRRCGRHPYRL